MSDGAPRRPRTLPGGVLPCGRSTDAVLDQVAAERAELLDDHQASCVHCRAALSETARLWAPVQALVGRVETPPPGLVEDVMRSVRALARDVRHVVLPGERGSTRIAARVIADTAQRTAARVPGVRLALGRRGREVGVAGRHVAVDLSVVVTYGTAIQDVAATVRSRVARALAAVASVESAEVRIHVDDVLLPPLPGPEV